MYRRTKRVLHKGGDAATDVSKLSTAGLGLIQKELYKIPAVGKVLKVVGENAEDAVIKALSLFGYKGPVTLPTILAKEKGIDVFEYNRDFTPDELKIFGYDWITPKDQGLYRSYLTSFPPTQSVIANYKDKFTNWARKVGILAPNETTDQALSSGNQKYARWNSVLSALTNAHGELGNVNSILYSRGLYKKDGMTDINAVPIYSSMPQV